VQVLELDAELERDPPGAVSERAEPAAEELDALGDVRRPLHRHDVVRLRPDLLEAVVAGDLALRRVMVVPERGRARF